MNKSKTELAKKLIFWKPVVLEGQHPDAKFQPSSSYSLGAREAQSADPPPKRACVVSLKKARASILDLMSTDTCFAVARRVVRPGVGPCSLRSFRCGPALSNR